MGAGANQRTIGGGGGGSKKKRGRAQDCGMQQGVNHPNSE